MPDHAQPRPVPVPSGAWPEDFTDHRYGTDCPMCANDFAADDIGWGLLVRRGEVSNACLWRSGAVEALYEPLKMNYLLLRNQIPHAHRHCVPRREAGTDPAPGGPLPFEVLDLGRQDEEQLQADARALRQLLNSTGRSGVRR
ncbi:histidine triad (HIT) protein [Streptomyces sp. NPDC002599]|uniref:histidine triad (HIT) protein n=1 Tax=Streptomyces sp. NPDC002599 TaxID=3154421 RepID=UPI00332BCFF5